MERKPQVGAESMKPLKSADLRRLQLQEITGDLNILSVNVFRILKAVLLCSKESSVNVNGGLDMAYTTAFAVQSDLCPSSFVPRRIPLFSMKCEIVMSHYIACK